MIDAGAGRQVRPVLPYALSVAELVDLAVAGRIALRGGVIVVVDRSSVGDSLIDDSLARLAHFERLPSVEEWLARQGRLRVATHLAHLRNEHVLRYSPVETGSPDTITILDAPRAAAPVERLWALTARNPDALSVPDLAFLALADSTGWPQVHLRAAEHHERRARLKRLKASVSGSAVAAGLEDDAAFAVLRHGLRAAAALARQPAASDRHYFAPGGRPLGFSEYRSPMTRPGMRLAIEVVVVFVCVTLVLTSLANPDLAVIIAPVAILLIALPIIVRAVRRARRRRAM